MGGVGEEVSWEGSEWEFMGRRRSGVHAEEYLKHAQDSPPASPLNVPVSLWMTSFHLLLPCPAECHQDVWSLETKSPNQSSQGRSWPASFFFFFFQENYKAASWRHGWIHWPVTYWSVLSHAAPSTSLFSLSGKGAHFSPCSVGDVLSELRSHACP